MGISLNTENEEVAGKTPQIRGSGGVASSLFCF